MPLTSVPRPVLLVTVFLLAGCTRQPVVSPPAHKTVVAGGLNGPQGVYVDAQNNVCQPPNVAAVVKLSGSNAEEVANTSAWKAAHNPDAVPPDQGGLDSHPYGITALNGKLYIADAAANDLLRLDPAPKTLSTVTAFGAVSSYELRLNRLRSDSIRADARRRKYGFREMDLLPALSRK